MVELIAQLMRSPDELGYFGIAALGLLFFAGAMTFVPRHPMCMASGLIFGLSAIPVVLFAATAGAVSAFLLSRYILQAHFLRFVERYPVWKAVISAVDVEGWKVVGLLRLASPIPATATNYLLGLTRIGLVPYTLATLAGIFPTVVLFVYLGTVGRMAFRSSFGSTLDGVLMIVGLIVTAVATLIITRRARATLCGASTGASPAE
jgi:uncharacterized membrane protein YdjX (TVP38/TMEM64 family)